MYRLHIDVPISAESLQQAQEVARAIMAKQSINSFPVEAIEMNYRLGHDDDRQRSNYLDMDQNGHCSHRKIKVARQEANGAD